jgi:hypothetical protein
LIVFVPSKILSFLLVQRYVGTAITFGIAASLLYVLLKDWPLQMVSPVVVRHNLWIAAGVVCGIFIVGLFCNAF